MAGEVSNLFRSGAGHAYFTLQDERARVRCVLFRGEAARLPFELEDGLEVIVYAEASIYESRGDLQLRVREVEPLGAGALQLAFEQLRKRLTARGSSTRRASGRCRRSPGASGSCRRGRAPPFAT